MTYTIQSLRQQVADGIDPLAAKREQRAKLVAEAAAALSFKEAAARYIAAHRSSWRNVVHASQWASTLEQYAFPLIGALPVSSIDLPLILKVLEPHWRDKNVTMSRLRGRIAAVLDWATVRGYRSGDNPAAWRGRLEHLLPAVGTRPKHHAAIEWRDVPAFMGELRAVNGQVARALELVTLTACRSGEALGASWDEIDLDARVWTIPSERMKRGREHRVPLGDRAVAILQALPRDGERVFGISPDVLLRAVQALRPGATVHGMRSSFRDWAAERTAYPREIAEACLAHAVTSSVERSYLRGGFWEKRVKLMGEWSRFCTEPTAAGDVVPMLRGA